MLKRLLSGFTSLTGLMSLIINPVAMSLSPTNTDIDSGAYIYDIVIESGSRQYTIVRDDFIVSDAVLY